MPKKPTLDELRARRGLTQEQLAEQAGIAWITLAEIERGMAVPRPETLDKLEAVLGPQVRRCSYGFRRIPKKRGRPRRDDQSRQGIEGDEHEDFD